MRHFIVVAFAVSGCAQGDGWSGHATQIAVGGNAACALEDDGQVACWGNGSVLQRGAIALGPTNECISPFSPSSAIGVFCSNPFGLHVATDLRFVEISASGGDTFCELGRGSVGANFQDAERVL